MAADLKTLEATAIRTQEAAGRAWADLQDAPRESTGYEMHVLQENYRLAKLAQDAAYDAWKAAGGETA